MEEIGRKKLRVGRTDRELFPAPAFGWDKNKYKEQLDQQVEYNKLKKQLSDARAKVLEKALLAEDRRQADVNKSFKRENIEQLRKTFFSAIKVAWD